MPATDTGELRSLRDMHTGQGQMRVYKSGCGDGLSLRVLHSLPACSILLGSFSHLLGQTRLPPAITLPWPQRGRNFSLEFQLENVQGRKNLIGPVHCD